MGNKTIILQMENYYGKKNIAGVGNDQKLEVSELRFLESELMKLPGQPGKKEMEALNAELLKRGINLDGVSTDGKPVAQGEQQVGHGGVTPKREDGIIPT